MRAPFSRVLCALGFVCFATQARAGQCPAGYTTVTVNPSMGQSTLASAIAGAGNTTCVIFAAGTYNLTGTINAPCTGGQVYTGPLATPATAIINPSFVDNPEFQMSSPLGCTWQYLNFTKTQSLKYNMGVGTWCGSGCNILHNQFTGLLAHLNTPPGGNTGPDCDNHGNCGNAGDTAVTFTNTSGQGCDVGCNTLTNTTIAYNQFGDPTSCNGPSDVMNGTANDYGGNCAGIQFYTSIDGVTVEYNQFIHVEEGAHVLCGPVGGDDCSGPTAWTFHNFTYAYNDIVGVHRIGLEMQLQGSQNVHVDHNSYRSPTAPFYYTFGISNACCAGLEGSTVGNPRHLPTTMT